MAIRPNITPELCRQLIDYDPETGSLTWLPRPLEFFPHGGIGGQSANAARWNGQYAGKPALNAIDVWGRRTGTFFGRRMASHRVCWAISYGTWPTKFIDHINGIPSDNRITNLRDVSHQENMRNKWISSNNTSGVNGVSWNKLRGKWEAYTKVDQKRCSLGHWVTLNEAKAARYAADRVLGFTMRHGSLPLSQ